ncbi:MAG: hypothetical protein JKY61_11085 [Planctomycetes bacterium]|nr:hypothetical protein [Planctomycetota bacterium]
MNQDGWNILLSNNTEREGVGVELRDNQERVAAEVFRNDALHTVEMNAWSSSIPEDILNWFMTEAKQQIGNHYKDGIEIQWS